ncbi:MAG: guanosine monophosphate reductase [Candidatus Thorarchaeota archaeon]
MFKPGYCYDDVLLVPRHSNVNSRDNVDLSVQLPRGIKLDLPFVSANMKTVTDVEMARAISSLGGLALLHRFDDYDNLLKKFVESNIPESQGRVGASVGIKPKDFNFAKKLYKIGCRILCVDVAHADHDNVEEFVLAIRRFCPEVLLIVGNIATPGAAKMLWEAGADVIKIGIGCSGVCTTRIETGNGYPQLSALLNVCNAGYVPREDNEFPIFIADGGIRAAGDCVKGLAFTDLVMIGNLFAGTDEAPGEVVSLNGLKYKRYAGSSTYKQRNVEGVSGLVPYRGPVKEVVRKLSEGIRSGCSYQGVHNLEDLKKSPEFVVISNSGLVESHPHDIRQI